MSAKSSTIRLIFNHVAFPPKLPGCRDTDEETQSVQKELVARLLDEIGTLKQECEPEVLQAWQLIEASLRSCMILIANGFINKADLLDALGDFKIEASIILYIEPQNCAVLIRKMKNDPDVVFEAFETSPTAEQALAATGALQWDFPGVAVSLAVQDFENAVFQDSFSAFIEKASIETIDEFIPKTKKTGLMISELRDTVDPAIITQFLMTVLEANGNSINPPRLRKRIKDDVCWDDAELPWRRSPFWLALRVCIQRLLYFYLGVERGRLQYKSLICVFLANLLKSSVHELQPEELNFLKAKLCRRLAKLEFEHGKIEGSTGSSQCFPTSMLRTCQKSIEIATNHSMVAWESFKKTSQRQISKLPRWANDTDLRLRLPNSYSYLRDVLNDGSKPSYNGYKGNNAAITNPNTTKATTEQFSSLAMRYSSLAQNELSIEFDARRLPAEQSLCEIRCITMANEINAYFDAVGDAYQENPEQMSVFILCLFEMWVHMDKCAVIAHPSLKALHPYFEAEMLDVILLTSLKDFERLQKVQTYLLQRVQDAEAKTTIFSDPGTPGSLADRYFDNGPGAFMLQLEEKIQTASLKAREAKQAELDRVNRSFQDLTERKAATSCTQRRYPDGTHDVRGCEHCRAAHRRYRLKIKVHEDYLPFDWRSAQKRAILLELGMPETLSAYRNTTWNIIVMLCGNLGPSNSAKPEKLLHEYTPLEPYNRHRDKGGITLASSTKSYLVTHYRWKRLPARAKNIMLPFSLNFSYYDSTREIWLRDVPRELTLAHHFALQLPPHLPFSALYSSAAFESDKPGPSSYETIASITECPSTLTVHEFVASKNLVGGRHRRWLSILAELGSSNINLSLLDTTYLFRLLAHQAGPGLDTDVYRAVHVVFKDDLFCNQLIDQIEHHVDLISENWRESHYMETMLALTLQLRNLCCTEASPRAHKLLLKIRHITYRWISSLRDEMRNAQELDISEKAARYCFLSALLCRRTYSVDFCRTSQWDAQALQCFVEATLAMQEALVVDISKFSTATRNMLIRDIKMAVGLRNIVRSSVLSHFATLGAAIDAVWPNPGNIPRVYSDWQFLSSPYDWWTMSSIEPAGNTPPQVVHYHSLEGHLLINGQPIGKLPADLRDSEILKELFGNQRLVAFPSDVPSMSYLLAVTKEDNHIYLGYRNNQLIVRAQRFGSTFELVPRNVFRAGSSFDLPEPLVQNCVHWVELQSGILHIRRHPRIWQGGSWHIDILKRTGRRGRAALVDPHSKLFKSIAQAFSHFEEPWMLTVIQPPDRKQLSVELKRMDLTFYVNRRNLLQCRQLAAEIDPCQDAGTFYGLQSMVVLRSVFNRSQRSVITPLGNVHCQRHGMHVRINIENDGSHARYGIDNVLGRVSSPAEPRLLYHKALLHALTSCFIPDPLTGRTGTEEALSSLQSGLYQPVVPLNMNHLGVLKSIANLAPRREYYPAHKETQQTVRWDASLTTTIQNDAFQPVIDAIIAKSEHLSLFQTQIRASPTAAVETVEAPDPTIPHLRHRAMWRRSIHERPDTMCSEPCPPADTPYIPRDGRSFSTRSCNVREIMGLLIHRPNVISTTQDLIAMLNEQHIIGGYAKVYTQITLEDSLIADLFHEWGPLISLCIHAQPEDTYSIMFKLGLLAFGSAVDMQVLRTIVSFFILEDLKKLEFPLYPSFTDLEVDAAPQLETLVTLMKPTCEIYRDSNVKRKAKKRAGRLALEQASAQRMEECEEFAWFLIDQWPCREPSIDNFAAKYINASAAMNAVLTEWGRLFQNLQFYHHIRDVQGVLDGHFALVAGRDAVPKAFPGYELLDVSLPAFSIPRLAGELMSNLGPRIDTQYVLNWVDQHAFKNAAPSTPAPHSTRPYLRAPETLELEMITNDFVNSECPIQSSYGHDLKASIADLKMVKASAIEKTGLDVEFLDGVKWLNGIITQATIAAEGIYVRIRNSLVSRHSSYQWLHQSNLWPCMMPISLLNQLRSTSKCKFGQHMKEALVAYGLAIGNVQRLIRLKEAFGKDDQGRLRDEYYSQGHVNWNPYHYPDWLLLEIDGNMQIREEQIAVAKEMISPSSGANSVLQMNMGKGKTSIIIPMIACTLADGKTLSRIIVPKALLSQTAQILQARLGGLLGREITHIPFSRRTPTSREVISKYSSLHQDMLSKSGIIVAVPEHILSFKLSGLQRMSDSRVDEAIDMIKIRSWMERTCRDILDECDFTLAVRTQLIYPSGSQLALDGHPDRWGFIMTVLDLLVHHLQDVAREFPKSVDLVRHSYTEFPVVYFLRKDAEDSLTNRLVDTICFSQTAIFPSKDFTARQKQLLKNFMSEEKLDNATATNMLGWLADKPMLFKSVHLLRGLFVHGILFLCLKKRWNVQYGLHPGRDPMAVPFYAKGVPSDQAEWGHPDVAILFTILAFYHQGITTEQLRQSLQAILRSDDPATEYDRWTQTSSTLPEQLCHWNIINVDDEGQIMEIWRHLRRKMVVVNYFLGKFVFPVHARQFSIKMQASGWDIPLMRDLTTASPPKKKTSGLTTGFSGTNDNRRLLPLTIQQHDLPGLSHTNAEVLTYLLQARNRGYIEAVNSNRKRFSEVDLLVRLRQEGIQVLIDAGAFILEMSNQALVKAWLEEDTKAQAAVYFHKDGKAWVQYQTGKTVPLIATPFVDNMENCLIYLDEAHTRGTDLKLPPLARGALTLGLNQTKDHTVQAAMRLRQLGTTQSITFVAPPEVHQSITHIRQREDRTLPVDSSDVLRWLLVQTCNTNGDLQPLYLAQGMDFCKRMQGAQKYHDILRNPVHQKELLEVLQTREHHTLGELYGPVIPKTTDPDLGGCEDGVEPRDRLESFIRQLKQDSQLTELGRGSPRGSALEEVEQEREVAYEMEEERELQRPGQMKALRFPGLSKSILEFVQTGALAEQTDCIKASTVLRSTRLGRKHNINASMLLPHLYVSPEFVRTVRVQKARGDDNFIRPVNWLLWSRQSEQAVVIIPEEAEALIPSLRATHDMSAVVHMILYAAPVVKRMLHFNHADYYSLPNLPTRWTPPSWLPFEIGILAGRLYFEFSEYQGLLERLSRPTSSTNKKAIVDFLREWLSLRRQGQDISYTPMGYLCQGLALRSDHPFFSDIRGEDQGGNLDSLFFTAAEHGGGRLPKDEDCYDSGDEEMGFMEVNGLEDSSGEDDELD